MTTKSIVEIKIDIINLTNDIKDLDYDGRVAAIQHMKETISLLHLGNELLAQNEVVKDSHLNLDHETLLGAKTEYIEDNSKPTYGSNEFLDEDIVLCTKSPHDQDNVEIRDSTHDCQGKTARCDTVEEFFSSTSLDEENEGEEILNLAKDVEQELQDDTKLTLDEKEESFEFENNYNTSLQIYHCNECPAYFYSEKPLKKHKYIHTDKYKCDNCQLRLCSGTELRMHQCDKPVKRRKISDFLFECEQCPKKYSKKTSLINHRNMHTDRYKCEDCNMRFQSISHINRHNKALHSIVNFTETGEDEDLDDYELISCDICEKFFSTKESLKNHTAVHRKISMQN